MSNQSENISMTFEPIGYVRCSQKYRYEAPRQATLAENSGIIELNPGMNFETALSDLEGFDHIWVIFAFHLNDNWKPKVTPPVKGIKKRVGVFATRSPHRPNPIGMSCVRLTKVEGRKLHIENFDMLDGTPILDIKPYIGLSDSHLEASRGWLPDALPEEWSVEFSMKAHEQAEFISERSELDLERFCHVQLASEPHESERKRIRKTDGGYAIGCRTWSVFYSTDPDTCTIMVSDIRSNYLPEELEPDAEDIYHDKDLHRAFLALE